MKPLIAGAGSCIVQNFITCIKMVCPELLERYDIEFYGYEPNPITRSVTPPTFDEETYGRMAVLIDEQVLWQGGAAPGLSREHRAQLNPNAAYIKTPAQHFTSLWPFVTEDPRNRVGQDGHGWGRYPGALADSMAIQIIKRHPGIESRVKAYKNTDIFSFIKLERFHELQVADLLEREEHCDIKSAAFILSNFRNNRLFYTHTHPSGLLYKYLIIQLFNIKTFQNVHQRDWSYLLPAIDQWIELAEKQWFTSETMAIHPAVADYFGLKWWTPDLRYSTPMGKDLSFDEWLERYMTEDIPGTPGANKNPTLSIL